METLVDLVGGFGTAFRPEHLLYCALGVTIGTIVGVLPGIGPALTVALLLPLTYNFDATAAFIMFAGIYYGGMYGGSTTSILLNTPGESASMISAIEGFQMAKRGRGGAALATAAIGSFVAGTLGVIALTFVGPQVASLAKVFQPADYFALMVLAFVSVSALVGRSLLRGMLSLFLGLFVGLIGIDELTGSERLTFGVAELLDGIDIVVVAIGLFAIGEALHVASKLRNGGGEIVPVRGKVWMTREEWRRSWKPWLRGTAIGFPLGSLPAGGAELPTVLSYSVEKQLAKDKDEFGNGAIEGVAGPEAANNAAFCGVLIPLLTIGLPTSATAAIMLAAFQVYNIQPGPELFNESGPLVWAMIASLYIGNVMLLLLNLPMVRIWVKLLSIPKPVLYSAILVFATLGVYSQANSTTDVLVAAAIGAAGFAMRRFDIPIGPMILGVILGPMLESQLRRAMSIAEGDASVLVTRPLSLAILCVAALAAVLPYVPAVVARLRGQPSGTRRIALAGADVD